MWERACSRIRRVSQCIWRLTHRLREQARSHKGPYCQAKITSASRLPARCPSRQSAKSGLGLSRRSRSSQSWSWR
ncbi:hypothetical protein DXU77_11050 [Pseudomonas lactis]|nr:hypothetical protein [Pseudomonas lactis]